MLTVDRVSLKWLLTRAGLLVLALIMGITAAGLPTRVAAADGGADLTVTDIAFSPKNPAIGDSVTVTATVKNQGTSACGASSLAGYADTALVTTVPVVALAAGQQTAVSFTWKAVAGTHNIKAVADSGGVIAESNEDNNARTFTLTTLAPDLIIHSITWTPASPSQGDSVVFSVAVRNAGNARSQLTSVNFYIDGNSRGYADVPAINAGSTATVTYNWVSQAGEHALRAVVDDSNRVEEANDDNNALTVNYLTMPPDLTINAITWSPENPSKDDEVTFTINVRNQGDGRADQFHLAYYIDGTLQPIMSVAALDGGKSANVTFKWNALPDDHQIRALADYYQKLAESNEANNEKTVTFSTLRPDLAVKNITWSPQVPAVGDDVTFTAVIENKGSGGAVASRGICYIDGAVAGYLDVPAIESGKETSVTLHWKATGGEHAVSVVADDDNRLTETREDNNKLTKTVPVVPPDLIVSKITWSPEAPTVGDTVTFTVTITNQGSGDASSFYVAHYVDDIELNSNWITKLASGAYVDETCSWKIEAGRHTFRAVADTNGGVVESDEANNGLSVSFAPAMPDLSVAAVLWSPADPTPGTEVTFSIDIENIGTLDAGPSRLTYYVDGEPAGYTDIGWMETGARITRDFPWVMTGGQHTVRLIADASDQVVEIDEENNIRVVNLPPPDLVVKSIEWSTVGAAVGEAVTFEAVIENLGAGPSTSATTGCYVDGYLVSSATMPEIGPGATAISRFDWKATAGAHTIKIVADSADRVTETNETNNSREVTFATDTPDLCFEAINWLMKDPLLDDQVTFNLVIGNRGSGAAGASRLKYVIDSGTALYKDIEALGPGGSLDVSFTARLEAGSHLAVLTLDIDDAVDEDDEDNNQETLTFSTDVPDLVVRSITWDPPDAAPGDPVTVVIKVENRGRKKAVGPQLVLTIDGTKVDEVDIPELDVGSIVNLEFTWTALEGLHEINVLADASSLVEESDETNNSRTLALNVIGPAATTTSSAGPVTDGDDKGFMGDLWWLALLVAALLGIAAFVVALKSFNREK